MNAQRRSRRRCRWFMRMASRAERAGGGSVSRTTTGVQRQSPAGSLRSSTSMSEASSPSANATASGAHRQTSAHASCCSVSEWASPSCFQAASAASKGVHPACSKCARAADSETRPRRPYSCWSLKVMSRFHIKNQLPLGQLTAGRFHFIAVGGERGRPPTPHFGGVHR